MSDVTFFSARFSNDPAPESINDMLGHDLAAWLREHLQNASYDVSEVIPEDYGYGFWLKLEKSHYWVWITQTQYEPAGFNDQSKPRWLVSIHYDPGCLWISRLRQRPHPSALSAIANAIHEALESDPSISSISWWAQGVGQGNPSDRPPADAT